MLGNFLSKILLFFCCICGVQLALAEEAAIAEGQAERLLDDAIYACMQGDKSLAFARFDQLITEYEPPSGILGLISFYKNSQCHAVNIEKNSRISAAKVGLDMAVGKSDNINQGITQTNLVLDGLKSAPTLLLSSSMRPKSDIFEQMILDYQLDQWQGMLSFKHYPHYDAYQAGSAYLSYTGQHFGGSLTYLALGGRDYLQDISGLWFDELDANDWKWGLKVHKQHYFQDYSYSGQQFEPFVEYLTPHWRHYLALLWDQPDGQRAGGEKKGFSFYSQYQVPVKQGILSAMVYYHKLYDAQPFSPNLLETTRLHQLFWLRLRYGIELNKSQNVYIESSYLHSEDRLSLYDYDSQQIMLGWQYHW